MNILKIKAAAPTFDIKIKELAEYLSKLGLPVIDIKITSRTPVADWSFPDGMLETLTQEKGTVMFEAGAPEIEQAAQMIGTTFEELSGRLKNVTSLTSLIEALALKPNFDHRKLDETIRKHDKAGVPVPATVTNDNLVFNDVKGRRLINIEASAALLQTTPDEIRRGKWAVGSPQYRIRAAMIAYEKKERNKRKGG